MSDVVKWCLAHQAEITGALVALLVFAHSLLLGLEVLARALGKLAELTPHKGDDEAARAVESWAHRAAERVRAAQAYVPRVSMGPRAPRSQS